MDFEERINASVREMIHIGYKPQAFMTMRIMYGTVTAIKKLVNSQEIPKGFTTLWERNRLDLSMKRLSDYGYNNQFKEKTT